MSVYHKLTAFFLICLMGVASATSQAGLRYCLCLQTVFVGDCGCSELVSAGSCTRASADSCGCSGCAKNEKAAAEMSLSKDCSVDLSLKLDDFISAKGKQLISKSFSVRLGFVSPSNTPDFLVPARRISVHGTRGSPPPFLGVSSVPLFLRHSVFLI
jgi:hypothetical protein